MWKYRCDTCAAVYESPAKADYAVCRTPGCAGRAVRVGGIYRHIEDEVFVATLPIRMWT
jgi:hypothetical protein